MGFEVVVTQDFKEWWLRLSLGQREDVMARVELLEQQGPALGRPVVDRIEGSRFHHMKELRCSSSGALRVLFAFDPSRRAVLLVGGDKAGRWDDWYDDSILHADELYQKHLDDIEGQGGN